MTPPPKQRCAPCLPASIARQWQQAATTLGLDLRPWEETLGEAALAGDASWDGLLLSYPTLPL
jgi:hypothetical protein